MVRHAIYLCGHSGIYTNMCALIDVFGHITDKRTPSRPLGEVKLRRAGPVVRWVTTREAPVLKALIFSFAFLFFWPICIYVMFQPINGFVLVRFDSIRFVSTSQLVNHQ
jgi:hypothetical protein